jgi:threonyl-tRNA synthetase
MLQRIYGTAFATPEELEAYVKQLEEARARDHRKLGKELELVGFHPWAPASPFFLPRGAAVYNGCVNYIRQLYIRHGYQEVVTPQVFDAELFHTSGHLPNFAEGMFHAAALPARSSSVLSLSQMAMFCPSSVGCRNLAYARIRGKVA